MKCLSVLVLYIVCGTIAFRNYAKWVHRRPVLSRNLKRRIAVTQPMETTRQAGINPTDLEGWTPPPISLNNYDFTPPDVSNEIIAGTVVSVIPIIWATIEFTSRIRTQQECLVCAGSGLTYKTRSGNDLLKPRKCWSCGGFLPWLGWKMFFFSSFVDPGNGGVLRRPANDYDKTQTRIRTEQKGEGEGEGEVNGRGELVVDDLGRRID